MFYNSYNLGVMHVLNIMINAKLNSMILLTAAVFYLSGCSQPNVSDMLLHEDQKKEIYSAILSNDQASSELMDSLMTKHHEQMMMKMHSMMMGDAMMQKDMMDKMMDMCNADSSMCKMMMGSMQSRPNVMKSMQSMCDMNSMKGEPVEKKEEHQNHH